MNRLRSQTGISLIEMLSAIALFSVVATGLSTSIASNMKLSNQSRTIAAATALVQNKIEQIRLAAPVGNPDLTTGPHPPLPNPPITALGGPNGTFTRVWNVTRIPQYLPDGTTVVGVRPGIVQVAVTVSWSTPVAGTLTVVTYACITPDCG